MSALSTSRRTLITAGLAAAAASSSPALASCQRAPDPGMVSLVERAVAAAKAFLEVKVQANAIDVEAARREPPFPEAVMFRGSDWGLTEIGVGTARRDGRKCFSVEQIAKLRAKPRMQQDWTVQGSQPGTCGYKPDPKAQMRADEIVSAYDGWVAAIEQVRAEVGVAEAEHRTDEAYGTWSDLEDELIARQAASIEDAIAKIGLAHHIASNDAEAFADTWEEATSIRLAKSVIRDLIRLTREAGR